MGTTIFNVAPFAASLNDMRYDHLRNALRGLTAIDNVMEGTFSDQS
jgi:hypothetical protein